jgi:stage V sporulation protein R
LTLRHIQTQGISLHEESKEVLKHLHRLWQFDVHLETVCDGTVITHQAYTNDDG